MHELDAQIRDYIDATSDPLTIEDIWHVPVGTTAVRPIDERSAAPRRWNRGWIIAGAAAVAVLVTVGILPLLVGGDILPPAATTIPTPVPATIPNPVPTTIPDVEPTTVDDTFTGEVRVVVEWTMATGALPTWNQPRVAPIVTNGSSFLGVLDTGDDNALGDVGTMVRSVDGVSWDEVASPIELADLSFHSPIAAGTHYLMDSSNFDRTRCGIGDEKSCSVQISADGLTWVSEPSAIIGDNFLTGWIWRVESKDSVLLSSPPGFPDFDLPSVVMEFDDRLIVLGTDHARSHTLGAFESRGQGTWTRIDPPLPFADVITPDYLEAGVQSMWRCEFAARDGQGMALIERQGVYELWNTNDGITWRRLPDPPTQPEATGRGRCIKALDDGWVIGPGGLPGGTNDFDTPHVTATPRSLLFSEDGQAWSKIEPATSVAGFAGYLETAGNTIYIMNLDTGEILVGTISPE
jgi:hypothetical protein